MVTSPTVSRISKPAARAIHNDPISTPTSSRSSPLLICCNIGFSRASAGCLRQPALFQRARVLFGCRKTRYLADRLIPAINPPLVNTASPVGQQCCLKMTGHFGEIGVSCLNQDHISGFTARALTLSGQAGDTFASLFNGGLPPEILIVDLNLVLQPLLGVCRQ